MYDMKADFEWFKANQENLVKQYNGKYLVIREKVVLGAYASAAKAVAGTSFPMGEYLVQRCVPGKKAYTVWIRTPGAIV